MPNVWTWTCYLFHSETYWWLLCLSLTIDISSIAVTLTDCVKVYYKSLIKFSQKARRRMLNEWGGIDNHLQFALVIILINFPCSFAKFQSRIPNSTAKCFSLHCGKEPLMWLRWHLAQNLKVGKENTGGFFLLSKDNSLVSWEYTGCSGCLQKFLQAGK